MKGTASMMMVATLVALVAAQTAPSSSSVLEWKLLHGNFTLDVPPSTAPGAVTPGGRELRAGTQSGDAVFLFGGSTEQGKVYNNDMFAWGTDVQGVTQWKALGPPAGVDRKGHYGALGNFSHTFWPSARAGSCMAFMSTSHMFMFGGRGLDSQGNEGYLNDLWSSEDFAQWAWLAGAKIGNRPQVLTGVDATPGARWKHSCGAHFSNKEFYIFGGEGEHPSDPKLTALLDDLWVFGAAGWERFFGSGTHSAPPDYVGTTPTPGGRSEHSSAVFENGFYVFGGLGVGIDHNNVPQNVHLADLWIFDLRVRRWAYLSGARIPNSPGNYPPALGVHGKEYFPGARVQAAMAFNELTNDLYIFGGFGSDFNSEWGYLNDLWRYNLNSDEWTWLRGSSSVVKTPAVIANGPCGRSGALLFAGNDGLQFDLKLFGGIGNPEGKGAGALDDVWTINTKVPADWTQAAPSSSRTTTLAGTSTTTSATTEASATTSGKATVAPSSGGTTSSAHSDATAGTTAGTTGNKVSTTSTTTTAKPTTAAPTQPKATPTHPPLFDATSPQKIAALVMGSFIAIVLMVGGIIFLGFAMTSSPPTGSRVVAEPYLSV